MQQLTAQGVAGRHQPRSTAVERTATASPTSTRATPLRRTRSARVTSTARSRSTEKPVTPTRPTSRPWPGWRWRRCCSAPRVSTSTPPGPRGRQPDDVDAQTMVADLDMLGGHVEDAFLRLIELVRRTSGDDRDKAREHLIGLFGAVGNDDPRVLKGRQSLASALFSRPFPSRRARGRAPQAELATGSRDRLTADSPHCVDRWGSAMLRRCTAITSRVGSGSCAGTATSWSPSG